MATILRPHRPRSMGTGANITARLPDLRPNYNGTMVLKVIEEKKQHQTKASKTRERVRGQKETWVHRILAAAWPAVTMMLLSPWPHPSMAHPLLLLSFYLLRPWIPSTSSLPSSSEISNFPRGFVRDAVSFSDFSWPPAELWLWLFLVVLPESFRFSGQGSLQSQNREVSPHRDLLKLALLQLTDYWAAFIMEWGEWRSLDRVCPTPQIPFLGQHANYHRTVHHINMEIKPRTLAFSIDSVLPFGGQVFWKVQ